MKVLVVGGGGREHALAWKIARSPLVEEVLCAPGNGGTEAVARNVAVAEGDLDGLVRTAAREDIDLVVIGPEGPLCAGLGDRLRAEGVLVFGPGRDGARLEGSKVFAKEVLERQRIPTAAWRRFDRAGAAKAYLETLKTWPQVVKADGLAAGKGVFVCEDAKKACAVVDAVMEERILGVAGEQIVIEDFLVGEEVSIHAITDGRTALVLEPVVDYKQAQDGDTGPNTGGMGVYSPAHWLSRRLMRQIEQRVLLPTLHALRVEEIEFRGTLFLGLMVTETGPRVLEYNCRFGDPETQAIVRRLRDDLVPYLVATARGRLGDLEAPEWESRTLVGVVAASRGYPGAYAKGESIRGLERAAALPETVVFHAGTRKRGQDVVTDGGRVLCVTALGDGLEQARERAYRGIDEIRWEGSFCRRDIGSARAAPARADWPEQEGRVRLGAVGGAEGIDLGG